MENLVDTVGHLLDGDAVKQMSSLVKEDEGSTRRAIETVVPVSIAGLARQASSEDGARSLLQTFQSGRYPHLDPEHLDRALSDPGSANLVASSSEGFVSRMFGTRLDGVLDGLAGAAGVSRSSARKLLGLATPLVMGLVGKRAASQHMDARGLAGFLSQQGNVAAGLLPDRMFGLLGMRPATAGAPAAAVATGYAPRRAVIPHRAVAHRRSIWPWLLAALVAMAALGWVASRIGRWGATQELRAPVTAPAAPVPTPPAVPRAAPEPPVAPARAAPAPIASVAQGAVGSFQRAAEQGEGDLPQRFVVQGLEFESGSAALRPETTQVLDDIASVMTANPAVAIRAEGPTDATGNPEVNRALSTDRANAIKDYLVTQGIGADRITTAGFASEQPSVANDTSEGRAGNRRTEIILLQR
jgi:OOP family OmpA-OmpF porin